MNAIPAVSQRISFPALINRLRDSHLQRWSLSSATLPEPPRSYPPEQQAANENELEGFFRTADTCRRHRASERNRARITAALERVTKAVLHLDARQSKLLFHDFQRIGETLACQARREDPAISDEDVYQAARNAWTGVAIQSLLGGALKLTPALYAYSMLYPYTDNYLDDPDVTVADKREFSQRLAARLQGSPVQPPNPREARIYALLDRIDSQYPPESYPEVRASLSAIQNAQTNSTDLRFHRFRPGRPDTLAIGFEKGGASVLADGYLAAGRLDQQEAHFAFGWGVVLQLGDDLQDIAADFAAGIRTVFTEAVHRGEPLDGLTNRLLHFNAEVLDELASLGDLSLEPLKGLIAVSARLLIVLAAGASPEHFTPEYIRRLERYSPVRFSFLKRNRSRFSRHDGFLGGVCGGFCRP